MRDLCIKTPSLSALVAALKPLGLTHQDESGNDVLSTASHDHALAYHGRVVETPGTCDAEGHELTPPAFHPGEYATLRATPPIIAAVLAATLSDGVEIVSPPAGIGTIGGVWLAGEAGPTLEEEKAAAIAQVKAASASLADYLWPRLKSEAVRLAVPPFGANEQAQYQAFLGETLTIQYEAAAAIEACETQEALAELLDDLRAMYGDSLGV